MQLGNNIREFRLAAGMSLRELADKVGISESFLSRVERAEAHASDRVKVRIAEALGKPLWRIFFQVEDEKPTAVTGRR